MEHVLICLTASHRNASFDLLERLSIGAPTAASRLVTDSDVLDGAVVLATCNRFEAYLDIAGDDRDSAVSATVDAVATASDLSPTELRDSVRVLGGKDVVQHLFAVSSGLESVVVGETEISGQVRRSLEDARSNGTTTSDLERLFQEAAHTSRGVKTRTRIGAAGRSLVRLGLQLASSRVTDWAQTRVLLIGTGSYAATTIAALRDKGAANIQVFSPSGRASWFAAKHDLVAASTSARPSGRATSSSPAPRARSRSSHRRTSTTASVGSSSTSGSPATSTPPRPVSTASSCSTSRPSASTRRSTS